MIAQIKSEITSCRVLLDNPKMYRNLLVHAFPILPATRGEAPVASFPIDQENGRFQITGVELKDVRLELRENGGTLTLADLIPRVLIEGSEIKNGQVDGFWEPGKPFTFYATTPIVDFEIDRATSFL